MAGTAYHMEALRRQRVLERKAEAAKRIENTIAQPGDASDIVRDLKESQQLVFSEPGQYAQNRYSRYPPQQTKHKKFIRRDAEMWPKPKPEPASLKHVQRDQVYHILHPKKICHRQRRAENEGEDSVMPLLNPLEYNFVVPREQLPPRKPHFKV